MTDTHRQTAPNRPAPGVEAFVSGHDAVAPPIRQLLEVHLDGPDPISTIDTQTIKKGVHRLTIQVGEVTRSVIIKRLAPEVAYRNQVLVTRWLPAVGLEESGPILLGYLGEADGKRVWHIYEDLGEMSLDSFPVEPALVEESVRLIA
ncbi:MAG TPA: hypothetical protein VHM29_04955, partial [Acidimicrobiia bacterium]|nr:hypothetical protein [Acidimicrobiia bacterium]